jgi:hypothetical protein
MLAPVLKHVNERVSDVARCPQQPRMVSITPNTAGTTEHAVDGLCDSDGETLEAACQDRSPAVSFDDEMDVVTLHGELKDPKLGAGSRRQSRAHRTEHSGGA